MSVYIRGMEMPKEYSVIMKVFPDGRVGVIPYIQWFKVDLIEEAQAILVPDHGRLIDADAKVQTQLYDDEHEEWTDVEMTVDEYLGYCHNEVPTIIPADKKAGE